MTGNLPQESSCSFEIDLHFTEIKPGVAQPEDSSYFIPPLRLVSLDLESLIANFSDEALKTGRIIQAGLAFTDHQFTHEEWEHDVPPPGMKKVLLGLNEIDAIPGVTTVQFTDKMTKSPNDAINDDTWERTNESSVCMCPMEVGMLCALRDLIHLLDPDVLTGYNVAQFDLPQLILRSQFLDSSFKSARESRYYTTLVK